MLKTDKMEQRIVEIQLVTGYNRIKCRLRYLFCCIVYLSCRSTILPPKGVLHKFRLHLCQRPVYKILVQNINNE